MDVRVVHCPACERSVRVALPEGVDTWPPRTDAAVCFEHGDRCTGELCPIFDVPPERMRRNLDAFRTSPPNRLDEEAR